MRISDELARESNLPVGTVVNSEQLSQLCEQKVARARKVQADADAKADADRQAEIYKLSAAQKLEQDKRDKEVRDLQRLSELIAPKPISTPEPVQLATARAIAQEKSKVEVPVGQ
jgi:hypothetical protein